MLFFVPFAQNKGVPSSCAISNLENEKLVFCRESNGKFFGIFSHSLLAIRGLHEETAPDMGANDLGGSKLRYRSPKQRAGQPSHIVCQVGVGDDTKKKLSDKALHRLPKGYHRSISKR